MDIKNIKESTLRVYVILLLMIVASYLTDFKTAAYGLIAAGIIGLLYQLGYYLIFDRKK